jgi:hypothetical protein
LQRVDGKVIPAAPVPGTKPPRFAEALMNLFALDLGPPVGSPVGVRWEPDAIINGKPLGALIRYGFHIPDDGVVITVGRKPTQELFWGLPDLPLPQKN